MKNNTLKIYVQSSCSSSRKAKKWLEGQKVPHEEIHMGKTGIPKEDIKIILKHTKNGFEDVIMKGQFDKSMEDMSFNQFVDYLYENQKILKSPILMQGEKKVLIGYQADQIGTFFTREQKNKQMQAIHAM